MNALLHQLDKGDKTIISTRRNCQKLEKLHFIKFAKCASIRQVTKITFYEIYKKTL